MSYQPYSEAVERAWREFESRVAAESPSGCVVQPKEAFAEGFTAAGANKSENKARAAGQKARQAGIELNRNPFPDEGENYQEWARGWLQDALAGARIGKYAGRIT